MQNIHESSSPATARCRICGSEETRSLGQVEFYEGYAWPIYDCPECGGRFTNHDDSVYEQLHSEASSCYTRYRDLLDQIKKLFDQGDIEALRANLSRTAKYKLVVDEVDRHEQTARVLEVGCSRGYLTSYAILSGRRVMGVDVSKAALEAATSAFGPHFFQPGAPEVNASAPYDLIYHVGTIGCVADPASMTRDLLTMLKPGGVLLFNAPNRDGCFLKGQLWIDSAPPPDLVTMFSPGFWRKHFSDVADVKESVESCTADQNVTIGLRKLLSIKWRQPLPLPLGESQHISMPPPSKGGWAWSMFERFIIKLARLTRLNQFAPLQPTEFGLFVRMTRK